MSRAESTLRRDSCRALGAAFSEETSPSRFPLPTARETAAAPRALDAHLPWTGKMLGELGLACVRLDGAAHAGPLGLALRRLGSAEACCAPRSARLWTPLNAPSPET